MTYAIELVFDTKSTDAIKSLWKEASDFYGTDYMLRNNVIPHIALLVGDGKFTELFSQLAPPSGTTFLGPLSFFANGQIVYLKADLPDEIINFHRQVYAKAVDSGCDVSPYYAPHSWVPHCTIAQDCTINLESKFPSPAIEAKIEGLILVEYPPTRVIASKLNSCQ